MTELDPTRIPHHIAIIPDGNRRWAKKKSASSEEGHREGADILMDIVEAARDFGVKVFTSWAFGTENWKRSPEEVEGLLWLIESLVNDKRQPMIDKGVRLRTIGDHSRLPVSLQKAIQQTETATAHCNEIQLVIGINYGGRDEMCRAFRSMLDDYAEQKLKKEDINEKMVSRYLDTRDWPDPDLLIRTSGEKRISNFLLWQISYAEIYTTDVLWPDFTPDHLREALITYQQRERRLGS